MGLDITTIIATGLTFIIGIGGWWAKLRIDSILKAIKEIADVGSTLVAALGDKNIDADEVRLIKKEAIEAIAAVKAIFK